MKKVIFICLLSISTCLSRPEDTPNKADVPITTIKAPETTTSSTIAPVVPASHVNDTTAKDATTVPAKMASSTQPQNPAGATDPVPPKGAPQENKKDTKPVINATTDKSPQNENVVPTDNKAKSNETVAPATDKSNKTETTTVKPELTTASTAKPSETPKATDIPPLQARGFDGPSFIGGIILTLGLLAIGFMGFKYYKNQTERNYHTL